MTGGEGEICDEVVVVMLVLGIDPGRDKCGLAVVATDGFTRKQVVPRREFLGVVKEFVREYNVDTVVLGDGTGSKEFWRELKGVLPNLTIVTIDEQHSTEEAREQYWQDHRPKGWRKVLPKTMQVPPEPYDDYVAVILAQRFFKQK